MTERGVKNPSLFNAALPDDRMVSSHTDVFPKHLRPVCSLVQRRKHLGAVSPRALLERIPLVHAAPLRGNPAYDHILRNFNVYDSLLNLRIEGMPFELRP